jgi:hypothetical protein
MSIAASWGKSWSSFQGPRLQSALNSYRFEGAAAQNGRFVNTFFCFMQIFSKIAKL